MKIGIVGKSRYIDADKLMERLLKHKVITDNMFGMGIARGIERAETAIEMELMTNVVEVRHGEWKHNESGGYACSECGCWLEDYYGATPEMMNYCFKCGAKMDGERSENGK